MSPSSASRPAMIWAMPTAIPVAPPAVHSATRSFDARRANQVILLTEDVCPYPHHPASIRQDQVDLVVQVECVGDAEKIGADATRVTSNRGRLSCRTSRRSVGLQVYFREGFSLQTGTGGASIWRSTTSSAENAPQKYRCEFRLRYYRHHRWPARRGLHPSPA